MCDWEAGNTAALVVCEVGKPEDPRAALQPPQPISTMRGKSPNSSPTASSEDEAETSWDHSAQPPGGRGPPGGETQALDPGGLGSHLDPSTCLLSELT